MTLTFSVDPTTLAASDITVTGATKGALSGTGTTRSLAISAITVGNGETVSVAIASPSGFTISGSPKTAVVYRLLVVGMAYQGGKIAYILQSGDPGYISGDFHGLIASTTDLSTGIQWYNGTSISIGTGTVLGKGQENTTKIVDAQGEGSYAAKLCDDYTNPDTGTGVYSDWYLPSKDELYILYANKTTIGGFADSPSYWSSSEKDSVLIWNQDFSDGSQASWNKTNTLRVRAIRSF
ncbi:MAG TPA: DUF1566 domain-containing protein [Spirochaetota bacterium]|nr:DUF1566 domain-containing protein [Spirochaetota bacterium]